MQNYLRMILRRIVNAESSFTLDYPSIHQALAGSFQGYGGQGKFNNPATIEKVQKN